MKGKLTRVKKQWKQQLEQAEAAVEVLGDRDSMTAMKKHLILILLLGFIVSCSDRNIVNSPPPQYRSFVQYYEEPDGWVV